MFNFCIAQSIRELVPGASSAAALLLSESDQRLLLETIRERAQMAMIDFALLGVAISSYREPNPPLAFLQDASHFIPILQDAALACGNDPYCSENTLKSLGRDFAAAVQLHSMVSEELAALLARSRSAVATRGGNAQTRAEELWGPGSWYSRLLAAMAGGDPLANPNLEPWKRPDEIAGVGVLSDRPGPWTSSRWLVPDSEGIPGRNWPSEYSVPFTEMDISEPQVHTLFQLAIAYNQLHLTLKSGGIAGCTVDTDQSAKNIYRWLEAEVRRSSCYHNTPTGCSDELVKPAHAFPDETYLLWERYRIHPDHARKLVGYLTENVSLRKLGINVPGLCNPPPFNNDARDARMGPQYLSGNLTIEQAPIDGPIGLVSWRARLSDQSHRLALYDRPLEDTLPAYSRNAVQRFPSPWDIQPWADAPSQGFLGSCPLDDTAPSCIELALDSKRLMGAMAAMSASRLMLMSSLAVLKTQHSEWDEAKRLEDYFAHAEDILRVLDGSIGADGVSLRPSVQRTRTGLQYVTSVTQDPATGDFQWLADVSFPAAGHPFWNRPAGASYQVCLIAHPAAGNLATSPDSSFFGTTIDLLVDSAAPSRCSGGTFWEDGDAQLHNAYDAAPKGWSSGPLGLPAVHPSDPSSTVFTLVAIRTTPGPDGVDQRAFQLLGSSIAFGRTEYAANGQYLAKGGTLGNRLLRASQGRPNNPTIPRYDGFDLPTNWVPPFTAELIGGGPGEASVDRYLTLAKSSADNASSAVAEAIEGLLAEKRDDTAMAVATARAQAGIREDQQKLCGVENPICRVTTHNVSIPRSWFPHMPQQPNPLVPDPNWPEHQQKAYNAKNDLDRTVYAIATSVMGLQLDIAEPVSSSITEPVVPAFAEYSGGALQSAFVSQWRAIRAIDEKIEAVVAAAEAAKARIDLGYAAMDGTTDLVEAACGRQAVANAWNACISQSCEGYHNTYCNEHGDCDIVGKGCGPISVNYGPLYAQRQRCQEATIQQQMAVSTSNQQALVAQFDGLAAVASSGAAIAESQAALVLSSAAIAQLVNEASLAKSRNELEQKLASVSQTTSFGLYRRYRSYDMWRAKAMVDNARMYALAARRAIEARYVVDLSGLSQPEAFVQSPATWADEVYDYDLSLPAAVGLSVGTEQPNGIYPNKVRDYVGNLESFVMGFGSKRPSAVASQEIDVVNLKGLKLGAPVEVPYGDDSHTVYAAMGEWSLHCSAESAQGEGWVPVPREFPASQACGMVAPSGPANDNIIYSQPDRARMAFTLDPWGRINDHIANEPYARRFNGRWDLMAVNFAGTGIKNCNGAPDPYACYSEGFIRYSLSHVGPAWVTDYDGFWRTLGVPIGRIEGAKALASELWLDPLKDGWNTPYISAVARTELQLRPLGGAYELEFVITPEIDIDRIERVQLLIGSTYWVKQD